MKIKPNVVQLFTAKLDSKIENVQSKVKSASFLIYENNYLLDAIVPDLKDSTYEAMYKFSRPGKYQTIWNIEFKGGLQSKKEEMVEVISDFELAGRLESELKNSPEFHAMTGCQIMALEAKRDKIPHYHAVYGLKGKDDLEFLNRYQGKNGFFIKKFLINDKFNLNNWKVTWDAIQNDIWDFRGKPVVRTPDLDHPPVSKQEDFRVGTIIDVGIDDINHKAWQVSQIFDKETQDMILAGKIEFGSPTVLIRSEDTREIKFKDTPQQQDILHRFRPAHDALVENPAYGKKVNNIPAVCTGDGPTCAMKLLEVSASLQYKAHLEELQPYLAKLDMVRPKFSKLLTYEEAEYVETDISRECGTCKYFQNPSTCHLPIGKPVKSKKGCCRYWDPGKKNEGDLLYIAEMNSDNTSQLTIVPFVRKMLKQRFTDAQLANVVTNAKSVAVQDNPPKEWYDRMDIKIRDQENAPTDRQSVINKIWNSRSGGMSMKDIINREKELLEMNLPMKLVQSILAEEAMLKADSGSCVSKKIKIIANEHPRMPHDQVIAIAYSYCRGKSKEADFEGVFMAELANEIIPFIEKN